MLESELLFWMRKLLRETPGVWHTKFHGNAFTERGVPDILACIEGRFFGIELKTRTGIVSELQRKQLERIIEAGGIGLIVAGEHGFEEFRKFLKERAWASEKESSRGSLSKPRRLGRK